MRPTRTDSTSSGDEEMEERAEDDEEMIMRRQANANIVQNKMIELGFPKELIPITKLKMKQMPTKTTESIKDLVNTWAEIPPTEEKSRKKPAVYGGRSCSAERENDPHMVVNPVPVPRQGLMEG